VKVIAGEGKAPGRVWGPGSISRGGAHPSVEQSCMASERCGVYRPSFEQFPMLYVATYGGARVWMNSRAWPAIDVVYIGRPIVCTRFGIGSV
jgi:hypothetical protein